MLTEQTLFLPEHDQQDWFLMTCLCLVIFELFRYIALVNELTKRYLNRKEDEITKEKEKMSQKESGAFQQPV